MSSDALIREISDQLDRYDRGEISPRADLDDVQRELAAELGARVHVEPDADYVYSDGLTVYFDQTGRPFDSGDCNATITPLYRMRLRFSWVAPYVLLDWWRTEDCQTWRFATDDLPPALRDVSERVRTFLTRHDAQVLSGPLNDLVPGRQSQMDDSPATIRQVLFGEID